MGVGIHEARDEHSATQIHHFSPGAALFKHVSRLAQMDDTSVSDRNGFVDRKRGVHGNHLAVVENEVGFSQAWKDK
jgi:hypothetical protein